MLLVIWGNLCKANTTFFSMASLINERIEVHSVSLKDKRAEPHLQDQISKEHVLDFPM